MLHDDGKGKALLTEKEYADAEFIVDFRFPKNAAQKCDILIRRSVAKSLILSLAPGGEAIHPNGQWNRLRVLAKRDLIEAEINGKEVPTKNDPATRLENGAFGLGPVGEMEFRNLFVRELNKQ